MSEETIINAVTRKLRKEQEYAGPERRGPQPYSISDLLKWLPLLAVAISGYGGYVKMQGDVDRLKSDFREHRIESKETHAALWKKVTE